MKEQSRFPLVIDHAIERVRRQTQTITIPIADSLEEVVTQRDRFAHSIIDGNLWGGETSATIHAAKIIVVGKDGQDSYFLGDPQMDYARRRELILELQKVLQKKFPEDLESASYARSIRRYIDRGQTIGVMFFGNNSGGERFMFVTYPKSFAKIPGKRVFQTVPDPDLQVAMHFFRQHPGYTDEFLRVRFR